MNNIREYKPDPFDDLLTIEEFEDGVDCTMLTDDDGYGYFVNTENNTELYEFDIYPSMIGTPAYEQRKVEWTHINWFNK